MEMLLQVQTKKCQSSGLDIMDGWLTDFFLTSHVPNKPHANTTMALEGLKVKAFFF